MADIFISYKREDQEEFGRVRPIAEALRAEGYDVFYDVQVPPGSSWEDVLQSKINAARAVLVLWSRHSVDSDWVKEEAEMAKHAGKLIPVFLDAVPPPFGFA
ncbi:MAG: toll/interleukin-1 receptor domain-containing protein, partial [Pseudomonadota bacterium]